MTEAVRIENVHFAYTPAKPILSIPSLVLPTGLRTFLHGPSGSGKTTLLSLISGVLTPQQGSVQVLGQELTRLSSGKRDTLRGASIGYIFQTFNLIPYLTVAENIAIPCRLHPERRARIAGNLHEEVARIARRLDLHAHLDAPVTRLSTGQQQRVAIARAVIGSPPLIIADEPTSSLDTDRRDDFLNLLDEVLQGATLLFVSHDLSLASHFDQTLSLRTLNEAAQ
ncbi:putative ABC transport system ATP-binding protein [Granulicella pectinivorans]|jgi:putative ABC transport system ATP-binding protein|uniref:Putative ABC transport system ATP-binding protein n=1 Tax=Granulicella pectinivorans TaxID=474950 RepID=A0A1I6M415_9BACT|nr:ABC transporter ATP-binding protein [Granulicella pectinivorans]SFS10421.1 putative ABC transport system ATP-binding protein [Granulicella pectinivorans]